MTDMKIHEKQRYHLPSSVPYLQFDRFAIYFANTSAEFHPDGVRRIGKELLVCELQKVVMTWPQKCNRNILKRIGKTEEQKIPGEADKISQPPCHR